MTKLLLLNSLLQEFKVMASIWFLLFNLGARSFYTYLLWLVFWSVCRNNVKNSENIPRALYGWGHTCLSKVNHVVQQKVSFWLFGALRDYCLVQCGVQNCFAVYSCTWTTFIFYDSLNSNFWMWLSLGGQVLTIWSPNGLFLLSFLTFWGPNEVLLG